jgi:prophage DNA circulation protein
MQIRQATDILLGFLNLVMRSVPSTAAQRAAPLLRYVAAIRADPQRPIRRNQLGARLSEVMMAADAAGASYAGLEAARRYLHGFHASDMVFVQVVMRSALVMTLATQCKVLARTQFRTYGEAQAAVIAIQQAFAEAKAIGIDQIDALIYRTLNTLAGAITAHLAATGLRLPRYLSYTTDTPMPSLYLGQRIYGNAARHIEIEEENRVVHPAFVPMELRVLSDAGMWEPRYPMPERALPGLRQPGQFRGPAELPFPIITR